MISNDVRPTGDRETLFPLQAAVGYSIAQTLFLGKRSVMVEGITDYWIIKALNDCLSAKDAGPALHQDTVLVPAGGTSRLMPLASIMLASTGVGQGHLMVLLDSDKEGDQAAKRLKDVFNEESAVLMLGSATGLTDATIEDLFRVMSMSPL
jgi:predicted ATP-dependent endonuclease of OLD family